MIGIRVKHAYQIGDALSHVPYMDYLQKYHSTGAVVVGDFNKLARNVLGPSYSFLFCEDAEGDLEREYEMHLASLWGYSGQVHMSQCFFKAANVPMPELPLKLDLLREPCGVPPGIVISPYSHSDMNGNKLWPHEQWLEVIRKLRDYGNRRFYVLGCPSDNVEPYVNAAVDAEIYAFWDQPLAKVLDLILQAPLFLSIDNGISHLAHYGGMDRHVLLYPGCFGRNWADNPLAVKVCGGNPSDVQPQHMVDAALNVLMI